MEKVECGICHNRDAVLFVQEGGCLKPRCQACAGGYASRFKRLQLIYPPQIMPEPTLEEQIKAAREHCMKMDWGETAEIWAVMDGILAVVRGKEKSNG